MTKYCFPGILQSTMQAIVYEGKHKMTLRHLPTPEVGPDDVLLKVRAVGICGTDLHIYNGGTAVKPGTVIGHEFSGEIVRVGKNVATHHVGQRAVGEHVITCGDCLYCRTGRPTLCKRSTVIGLTRPGALAEYLVLPAPLVYPIADSLNFADAALIEPLSIAVYAAREAGFLLEKRVGVIGQGPIGLFLDQVLQAAGARVIGFDTLDHRLQFAQKQGWIDHAINPKVDDVTRAVEAITHHGFELSFEAVGNAAAMQLALDVTRKAGKVFLLGVYEGTAALDVMQIVKKELTVSGSWTCAFAFPTAIKLVERGKVDVASLITHRYALADAPQAFADAATYSEKRIKTVIEL